MNHTEVINTTTEFGVPEVVAIGISTVIAVVLIATFLMQRGEVRKRLRPWIASYGTTEHQPVVLIGDHIDFYFKNRGPVPAFRVQTRVYSRANPLNQNDDVFETIQPDPAFDLGPTEGAKNRIEIEPGIIDTATNTGTVHFGIRIDYLDVDKKTKKFYEYVGHFTNNVEEIDNITMN